MRIRENLKNHRVVYAVILLLMIYQVIHKKQFFESEKGRRHEGLPSED